MSVPLNNY
ncbi:UNVERIFIED_CONTAM: hypothetical protein GTU68_007343 [Idotea baltica]|nr:hypothetical protein [Idotea baltica]MCL4129722.1 hypothetical protein [Idotea baltica]